MVKKQPQRIEEIQHVNAETVHRDILHMIQSGSGYIDALIEYSDKTGMEVETLGEIIKKSQVLKAKIQEEAEDMNLVKAEINGRKQICD